MLLSIVNSLAVIYVYNQFSSLRKAGSKYLLGMSLMPSWSVVFDDVIHTVSHVSVMSMGLFLRNGYWSLVIGGAVRGLSTSWFLGRVPIKASLPISLPGIAGLFTIFAGFVFGTGVVNLIDDKVSGLK